MGDSFTEALNVYYSRFFPYEQIFDWLNYGGVEPKYFANRELSFTLQDDIYIRYLSFNNKEEMIKEIQRRNPHKIDIGAVYNSKPKDHNKATDFQAIERELVFDIDMTDYDDVRSCCKEANICNKCWTLMTVAIKVIDRSLRQDFGFRNLLWVYSGRRGVHCWVCDESARKLSALGRSAVADYLSVVKGGADKAKKVTLKFAVHPMIKESINIIQKYVPKLLLEDQGILDGDKYKAVVNLIKDDKLQAEFMSNLPKLDTSKERWNYMKEVLSKEVKNNHFIEEIILQYCYPRLDVNVSKGLNHLLKAPFCVHPKTGQVCIPIDVERVDKFDPLKVPKLGDIINQFNEAKKNSDGGEDDSKDYMKTSLQDSVKLFERFLQNLEASRKSVKVENVKQDW